jgi:hypothetical protein
VCQLVNACGKLPRNGGDRPQVVVTIDYGQLCNGLRAKRGAGALDNGTQLSPADVRRLACDAEVIPIVLDGKNQVLDVGRERRTVSGAIRRALVVRDKGCAFPECGRPPRWCQGHHAVHWADGGKTSLENSVLVCPYHHRLIHHGGWKVRMKKGFPVFIPPDG